MRKESRAMDSQWALEVMHKAPYITVSFIDEDGKPYGLPLSLASDDDVNWYFHGALEGKKLEAIKAHSEVCLSAVTHCAPTVGPKDGSFTLQFKSAIAFGKAEIVTEDAEKIHGLRLICERFLPQHMDAFDQSIARSLSRTAVVRITLTEPPTGKRKQYDKEGVEMKYGKTAAQVALRWLLQSDVIIIPKTVHKERMQENLNLFDFELDAKDMQKIAALDTAHSLFLDHHSGETTKQFMEWRTVVKPTE